MTSVACNAEADHDPQADLDPQADRSADAVLRRERALVAAALAAVAALAAALPLPAGVGTADALHAAFALGTIDGDSLLVASRLDDTPRLVASLARDGAGDLRATTLSLDPATVVLSTYDRQGPLDAVLGRTDDIAGDDPAVQTLRRRLAVAASALSIVRMRLDLQANFVLAILSDEPEAAPGPSLPALDAAGARDMALAVHAMLAGRPIAIVSSNRRTLQTLFS